MTYIKEVTVDGFWGNHKFGAKLKRDVNFVVGVNGSGKTTFIHLLAAALSGNISDLLKISFEKISVTIGNDDSKLLDELTIAKTNDLLTIKFESKNKPKSNFSYGISLTNLEKRPVTRRRVMRPDGRSVVVHEPVGRFEQREISAKFRECFLLDWLPVLRTDQYIEGDDDAAIYSNVDQKLWQVTERLQNYFNELNSEVEKQLKEFQQESLLGFFGTESLKDWELPDDLEAEKQQISKVFKEFGIPHEKIQAKVTTYFKQLEEVTKTVKSKGKYRFDDEAFVSMISWPRIRSITKNYEEFIKKSEDIYSPRKVFFDTVKGFFQRKELNILLNKRLGIKTESGKELTVLDLSSGEKQLLILLGECLLQKNGSWIYIADEPELSMHINWQNSLVHTLRNLNPNAQIIFATHSPEIMAEYPDSSVIDMETHIK